MTLRNTTLKFGVSTAIFVAILAIVFAMSTGQAAKASAPSGLIATMATTSSPIVTSTQSLVIATSTCTARVISTTASPIMITFTDVQGKVPSATFGFLQPASSTVAYDGGLYGCGAVRVYSFVSGTITVADSR